MRGRKPTPTLVTELHGNPGNGRKKNLAEPKPIGNASEPPDFLSEDQKAGWNYLLRHMAPGVLKLLDRSALAAFVIAEDTHRLAAIEQNKVGLLVETKNGLWVQSPFLPIINKQALIMIKLASELGFTPASRPRLFATPTAGEGFYGNTTNDKAPAPDSFDAWLADDPDEKTVQ